MPALAYLAMMVGCEGEGLTKAPTEPSNTAPRITSTPLDSVIVGFPYHYQPTAVDDEGDSLTWALLSGPAEASFSESDGAVSLSPRLGGEHAIALMVSDLGTPSLSDTQTFTLRVVTPPYVCEEIDTSDGLHYRIRYPNGGETLYVGDTVVFDICTEDPSDYHFGQVTMRISSDGGRIWNKIDVTATATAVSWVVAESVYDSYDEKDISLLTNQCLLRIESYQNAANDYDVSDGMFSIAMGPTATETGH